MDLKQIEKLMAAMTRSGMKRIVLKQEGFEIELEKESAHGSFAFHEHPPSSPAMRHLPPLPEEKKESPQEGKFITSPMVGTFYAAASPDSPPYVRVGDKVEEGRVVCIIEAMKVMNEVKATVSGTVAEILLRNGDPIEFGTKLFRVT